MNESKMTPGPWTVGEREFGQGRNDLPIHAYDGTGNVGVVFGTILSENPEHAMNQEQAANARAIAALPELIRACQTLLRYEKTVPDRPSGQISDLSIYEDTVQQARAALAKAGL